MKTVVQKYGGSSVANAHMLKRVADKIVRTKQLGKNVVVVVSAMGDATDELLNLARQVSARPSARELDLLLSVGERISMTLLSMAINDLGYQAISFTGSQSGIITDSSHTNARIIEIKAQRIKQALKNDKIVIVAGYQGVSLEKEVTTLGRGGSDATAVSLAAALDAERCEIYSDVDGVYTADPKIVADAKQLDRISYDDMQAFASAGAVVLNEQAVEYARLHNIKIYAAATFSHKRGTEIVAQVTKLNADIIGISAQKDVLCFCLTQSKSLDFNFQQIFDLLLQYEISPKQVIFNRVSTAVEGSADIVLICPLTTKNNRQNASKALQQLTGIEVKVTDRFAIVSVIGSGINCHHLHKKTFLSTLQTHAIEIAALNFSERRLDCLLLTKDVNLAMNELHKAFALDK